MVRPFLPHVLNIRSACATDVNEQLKLSRDILKEHEEHLKALEAGEPFEPKLTAKAGKAKKPDDDASMKSDSDSDSESESEMEVEDNEPKSKKRKNKSSDKQRPAKKRKPSAKSDREDTSMDVDDDDFEVEDELIFSDEDEDMDKQDKDSSDSDSDSDSGSEKGSEKGDADEEEEEVTPEILRTKIEEVKQAIKDGRVQLSAFRQQRKDAVDMLATLKKKQNEAQRRKNAFCSLKRSEVRSLVSYVVLYLH